MLRSAGWRAPALILRGGDGPLRQRPDHRAVTDHRVLIAVADRCAGAAVWRPIGTGPPAGSLSYNYDPQTGQETEVNRAVAAPGIKDVAGEFDRLDGRAQAVTAQRG